MANDINLREIQDELNEFAKERDWEKFHSPKNLTMALSVEASELLEIFQWLTEEESYKIKNDSEKILKVKDEVSDIFVYLMRICSELDIDLLNSYKNKMQKNRKKYPAEKVRGKALKYNEYKD